MKDHATPRAFTLVEVMVGLGILAFASVALGAAYLNVLQNIHVADLVQAQSGNLRTARSIVMGEPDRKKAERGGDFDFEQVHMHWSVTIDPTKVADLFCVSIVYECTGSESDSNWTRSESLMLLRPSWSNPDDRARLLADAKSQLDRPVPSQ